MFGGSFIELQNVSSFSQTSAATFIAVSYQSGLCYLHFIKIVTFNMHAIQPEQIFGRVRDTKEMWLQIMWTLNLPEHLLWDAELLLRILNSDTIGISLMYKDVCLVSVVFCDISKRPKQ